jgi:hypothetical protein
VHADASAPERWRYVANAEAAACSLAAIDTRVVFCGRTHTPMVYRQRSIGQAAPFTPLPG